jgi:site-specific DNA-methyltransferase (adenine-specific)
MIELHHGDCLDIMKGMNDNSIDLIVADPPYGIDFQSAWRIEGERFAKIKNDKEPYTEWIKLIPRIIKKDGAVVVFCRWDVQETFKKELELYIPVRSQIIWDRETHGLGDLKRQFAPQHDVIWFACYDEFAFPNGRPKSVIRSKRVPPSDLVHPNEKPLNLIKRLIYYLTENDDTVYSPFMGSGVDGVASVSMGRNFVGTEKDEHYFEIAKKRIEAPVQKELL